MPKISNEEYCKFIMEYSITHPQHLRLGQAFFNKFLTHDEEVDNLFYEENPFEATRIIFDNYII